MLTFVAELIITVILVLYLCQSCVSEKNIAENVQRNKTDQWKENYASITKNIPVWNGTKPPFPRQTPPCTKNILSYEKFPYRLAYLRSGKKVSVLRRPQRLHRQSFAYPESSTIPTLFELIDEIICESLENPEVGFSDKLIKDIDMFYDFLQRAKRMFIDKEEEELEALRYSIFRLFVTKGGPKFTSFPINNPEFKKKLVEAFSWNDKDLEMLRKRQKLVENTWYRVQTSIFDINQLRRLREKKLKGAPLYYESYPRHLKPTRHEASVTVQM